VKASGIPEEATELNSPNGVVCFTPQSGPSVDMLACPLRADFVAKVLMVSVNSDSVALMRFAAEAGDDGAA